MDAEIPENAAVVGRIEIVQYLDEHGAGTAFSIHDMGLEEALGYLMSVTDRVKKRAADEWEICPDCGRPWSEHALEEEEDDDELPT